MTSSPRAASGLFGNSHSHAPGAPYDLPQRWCGPRVIRFERHRLESRIHRHALNTVVPPIVGGEGLLRVALSSD
jgi:hypothetical protein